MQWLKFIFSEERKHKLTRHIAFWSLWWIYFLFSYWLMQQPIKDYKITYLTPGGHLLLKISLLVVLFAIGCYAVLNYIFPQIINGKWFKAIAYFFLVSLFVFTSSYFLYWNIFSWIDASLTVSKPRLESAHLWPPFNLGVMNFIKVIVAACSIKYVKYLWQKQKEARQLEREKINAELQLLKAQVHPDFLFNTLNNIYRHSLNSSHRAPEMLLKLSDLLSYMLYECNGTEIPIKKEIEMMEEYMELEKIRYNDKPETQVNIKGDDAGKTIAPFLLLPFIEHSFQYGGKDTEKFWINMDIRIDGDHFSMKIIAGTSENIPGSRDLDPSELAGVQMRLALLYPGKHELRISMEQEMYVLQLDILLGIASLDGYWEHENFLMPKPDILSPSNLKYAAD